MKNKISLLLLFFILFSVSFSESPIGLHEIIELTLNNNNNLKVKSENIKIKEYDYKISDSKFLPNIFLESSHSFFNSENAVGNPWIKDYTLSDEKTSAHIVIKQPLYNGGKLINQKKNSLVEKNSADIEFNNEKQKIIFETSMIYYDLLQQYKLLELNNKIHSQLTNDKKNVEVFVESGSALHIDILKISVEIINTEKNIEKIKSNISYLKDKLKIQMGINSNENISVNSSEINIEALNKKYKNQKHELINTAYSNRGELKLFNNNIKKINYNIKTIEGEKKPSLNLSAQYGYDMAEKNSYDNWRISLSFSLNIYDGFSTKHHISKLNIERENIKTLIHDTKRQISADIRYECNNIEVLLISINKSIENIEYAEENLRIEKLKYETGSRRVTDLINAENILLQAEKDYYNSIYNLKKSELKLQLLAGNIEQFIKEEK